MEIDILSSPWREIGERGRERGERGGGRSTILLTFFSFFFSIIHITFSFIRSSWWAVVRKHILQTIGTEISYTIICKMKRYTTNNEHFCWNPASEKLFYFYLLTLNKYSKETDVIISFIMFHFSLMVFHEPFLFHDLLENL